MTRLVLSQSSYGIKVNSKPTALLVSFGEIFKPDQQFTEDKNDKVVQMEKIKLLLQLGIHLPRVYCE